MKVRLPNGCLILSVGYYGEEGHSVDFELHVQSRLNSTVVHYGVSLIAVLFLKERFKQV